MGHILVIGPPVSRAVSTYLPARRSPILLDPQDLADLSSLPCPKVLSLPADIRKSERKRERQPGVCSQWKMSTALWPFVPSSLTTPRLCERSWNARCGRQALT